MGRRRRRGRQAGREHRKDLHHGLAGGYGNDPVEGLAAAEVRTLLFVREEPGS